MGNHDRNKMVAPAFDNDWSEEGGDLFIRLPGVGVESSEKLN